MPADKNSAPFGSLKARHGRYMAAQFSQIKSPIVYTTPAPDNRVVQCVFFLQIVPFCIVKMLQWCVIAAVLQLFM